MDKQYAPIMEGFANAAKARSPGVVREPGQWQEDGVRIFKRKIMGFCGSETIKSLDELARVLQELGVVSKLEDGRGYIRQLSLARTSENELRHGLRVLKFTEVTISNQAGPFYKIENMYGSWLGQGAD